MERLDLFQDIATRTSGDVYIGVVGPVRTGKSTFIKKFMEILVIPRIEDPQERERTIDELPQSGAGRTVMTTEPKFVPDEAVALDVGDGLTVRVRLADSVGFPVEGARGYEEEDGPRMVVTPWFDHAIPFEEAAETGTRKIITDHSTLGILVTTDGSIGDLSRDAFEAAEDQAVREVKAVGKPFVILLNSRDPRGADVLALAEQLQDRYEVPVLPVNLARIEEEELLGILRELLFEFPVTELHVRLPKWVEELDEEHWLRVHYRQAIEDSVANVEKLREVEKAAVRLNDQEHIERATVSELDLGNGMMTLDIDAPESLFWQVLEEVSGFRVDGKDVLLRLMRELAETKKLHEKIGSALESVRELGYAVVAPSLEDMNFEEPEMIRKGQQYGIRLRANATALHFLRTDISTEVTPIIGTEKQSEQLVQYLLEKFEDDPSKIWESDIFGSRLSDLLRQGILDKLDQMPENAREKVRLTVERIVNEGSGGLIAIIL